MSPIDLNQTITLWKVLNENGSGGYVYSAPLAVPGKYALKAEMFRDVNGDSSVSKAVFYTLEPFEALTYFVFFGESAELSPPINAEMIQAVSQNPSMFGELRKGWV